MPEAPRSHEEHRPPIGNLRWVSAQDELLGKSGAISHLVAVRKLRVRLVDGRARRGSGVSQMSLIRRVDADVNRAGHSP